MARESSGRRSQTSYLYAAVPRRTDIVRRFVVQAIMQGNRERWKELCEQAAVEQNPKRLLELAKEIERLLAEKLARPKSGKPPIAE